MLPESEARSSRCCGSQYRSRNFLRCHSKKFSSYRSGDREKPRKLLCRQSREEKSPAEAAASRRSWQPASGFLAQSLKRMRSLPALSIAKLPCWEVLYAGIDAEFCFITRAWHSAFDVRNVSKGTTEDFLLICTMRAPIRAIHFGLLSR